MSVRYNAAKLATRLGQRSPILRWLESEPETEARSVVALFHALAHTTDSVWVDRAVAFHILGTIPLSPMERDHAMHILLDAVIKPEKDKFSLIRFGVALGIAVPSMLMFYMLRGLISPPPFGIQDMPDILMLSLFATPCILAIQADNEARITQRIAATALAQVGTPDCIAALHHQAHRQTAVRREAFHALKGILPSVTSDWYGQLPSGTSPALEDMARSSDTELALAALNALEQAGPGSTAKGVERIAMHADASCVRERAALVLPILVARQAHETAAATLLRASARDLTEGLLRPVSGSNPNVTDLLRASQVGSPDALLDIDGSSGVKEGM